MMIRGQTCLVVLVMVCSMTCLTESQSHKRVCYFTNWSQYRAPAGRFTVANVDPFLCTHLIYAFVDFDGQGNIVPQNGRIEFSTYAQFNGLKQRNKDLKTLVAIGGWNFGSTKFSLMAGNPVTRTRFVSSVVSFLRQHGFDGLDLDWEYPGQRGGSAKDKDNFVLLCKELKQAFALEANSRTKGLILSAAVAAGRNALDLGYNVAALDRYLDLWNVMTYDYHGSWEGKTGHNSPLYPASREPWAQRTTNMEWSIEEYVRRGASKHKVMVGLPTYGRTFTLRSPTRQSPGDSATLGVAGPYTREQGIWAYYEICQRLSRGLGVVRRDAEQRVPYYVEGDLWISFDDVESIQEKTRWLKSQGYGGFMSWALDMDVFNPPAQCPSVSTPFPLLSAAAAVLQDPSQPGGGSQGAATTWKPWRGSTVKPDPYRPTTPSVGGAGSGSGSNSGSGSSAGSGSSSGSGSSAGSGSSVGSGPQTGQGSQGFSCAGQPNGGYSDPASPCRFIVCFTGTAFSLACPPTLVFDQSLGVCVRGLPSVVC